MLYEGCNREEIETYMDLIDEPFDFGNGLIYPSGTNDEFAYYNYELDWYKMVYDFEFEETINELNYKVNIPKRSQRRHHRNRYNERLKHFERIGCWWLTYDSNGTILRMYKHRSNGGKKFAKNYSNRVNRRYNGGYGRSKGSYKKLYRYNWWVW